MYYCFEIPLAPVVKKNSQQILINPKTKRPFIAQGKRYKDYAKESIRIIRSQRMPEKPINVPVNVCARFWMPTRRRCDTVNLEEGLWDILVEAGVLADDCRDIIASDDGSRTYYDKNRPRTEVVITPYEEEYEQWRTLDEC